MKNIFNGLLASSLNELPVIVSFDKLPDHSLIKTCGLRTKDGVYLIEAGLDYDVSTMVPGILVEMEEGVYNDATIMVEGQSTKLNNLMESRLFSSTYFTSRDVKVLKAGKEQ